MPKMFGTDGVRGLANRDLTARLALDLGDAAVRVLGQADAPQDKGGDCILRGVAVRWSAVTPVFPVISCHRRCRRA